MTLACVAAQAAPVDKLANKHTLETFFLLDSISKGESRLIISGQYAASPACCSVENEIGSAGVAANVQSVIEKTGKVPGLIGWDYNDFNSVNRNVTVDYKAINQLIIGFARSGSLTTISYHARNPWTNGAFNDTSCPGALSDLIDPDNPVAQRWTKQIDRVAAGLQELQEAGVTVLWRPFLEMNGDFFWWGKCKPNQAEFRAVWRAMFQYFTVQKGLHNLIWVYAQNGPSDAPLLYPGNDLVDIMGFDDYHDSVVFPGYQNWKSYGKPLAFTEKGPHELDGRSNVLQKIIPAIQDHKWNIAYVLFWGGDFGLARFPEAQAFMNNPLVANQKYVKDAMDCLAGAQTGNSRTACLGPK